MTGIFLILVGPEYEDLEVWYPKLRVEEAGFETRLAGIGEPLYHGKHGYPCPVDGHVRDFPAPTSSASSPQAVGPRTSCAATRWSSSAFETCTPPANWWRRSPWSLDPDFCRYRPRPHAHVDRRDPRRRRKRGRPLGRPTRRDGW